MTAMMRISGFIWADIVIVLSCAIVALLLPVLKLSVFGGLGNYSGYFLLMYVSTALIVIAVM